MTAKTFVQHGAHEGDEQAPRQRNPDQQWPHKPLHRLFVAASGAFVNPRIRKTGKSPFPCSKYTDGSSRTDL